MANKFRFTNEKCPVCNNTFKEDDDIAVCPECGTPHHRECYKQNLNAQITKNIVKPLDGSLILLLPKQ